MIMMMVRQPTKLLSFFSALAQRPIHVDIQRNLHRAFAYNAVTRTTLLESSPKVRQSSAVCRLLCDQAESEWTDISLPRLKALLAADSIRLIDVRQPEELAKTGKIANAINIPVGELEEALKLTEQEFSKRYQVTKPGQDAEIVFTCLAGVRSRRAMNLAHTLGYADARHYVGGWEEWAAKELGK